MTPIYGWGSIISRQQSPYKEVVFFLSTKFSEIPGTHLIDLGRTKD